MKLIIAGSRRFNFDIGPIQNFVDELIPMDYMIDEVVWGGAQGVDRSGKDYAEFQSIPVKSFLPDWDKYGKAAGPIRNSQMADYADALLLIWDGESRGSASMKQEMLKRKKPVYEVTLRRYNV